MQRAFFFSAVIGLSLPVVAGTEAYRGTDPGGSPCEVRISSKGGEIDTMDIRFADESFLNLPLRSYPDGSYRFRAALVDQGRQLFVRTSDLPFSIGNLGLVQSEGQILVHPDGQPAAVNLSAVGGLFNWWSAQFSCRRLSKH